MSNILYPGTIIVRVMSTVPGTGGTVMSSATVMMSLRSTTVYGKYILYHTQIHTVFFL